MPDLRFSINKVEAAAWGIVPLLHFTLAVENASPDEVHSVILQAQIQIQPPRRTYNTEEKQRLSELFGTPDRWGQTLRNRLWTHAQVSIPSFTGRTEVVLPVQCTYDLDIAATKYFHALDGGEVPLLFLFSGTVFYAAGDGRLKVQPISWDKECEYRMPLDVWRQMMEEHYPNTAWIFLRKDTFEHLYAFRRRNGLTTWEQTVERLLEATPKEAGAL